MEESALLQSDFMTSLSKDSNHVFPELCPHWLHIGLATLKNKTKRKEKAINICTYIAHGFYVVLSHSASCLA